MATATATAAAEVAAELLDQVLPVAELLTRVSVPALARSWITGEVEFGRRAHIVTGKPGTKSESVGSVLVVESAVNWTGAKTVRHKPLKDLLAEDAALPECGEYRKYVPADEPDADGRTTPGQFKQVPTSKTEAHEAIALLVRLTDKGLASLQS